MRAFHRIVTAAAVAALAAGCEDTLSTGSEAGLVADIIGSIEQLDSNDLSSEWIGTEYLRVVDTDGEVVCESDWDLDAIEAGASTCAGCEPTLDVVRSLVEAIADDCTVVTDTTTMVTQSRYLAYSQTADDASKNHGRVLVADSMDGPWDDYAGGAYYGDRIVYHRSVPLDEDGGFDPTGDLRLRPLHQEPIRLE